jgi:ATP-dependent RNA helicase DDX46/PRP5
MGRRDRSFTPETPNKRVRPSYRSPRSPSPTRRNTQRTSNRSRYDEDRERERERDRDRPRDRDRDRDRYRDDRHRDDRRRDSHRDDRRPDRRDDRRRSSSRDRRDRDQLSTPPTVPQPDASSTPPVEDEKIKATRARIEAWKKDRDAKKALVEAKAKAMALAGKSAPGELYIRTSQYFMISHHLIQRLS